MFSCVIINRTIVVVKTAWCQGTHSAETLNNGFKKSKKVKIFYSADENSRQDFEMQLTNIRFSKNRTGLYEGHVLKSFGEYFLQLHLLASKQARVHA